ncbi:hypothetical protein [Luteolibacter luteus]|uniref:Uncharacterized protein n=1 Tax=Luteolibacter luteus TaxID=2728835 RepID=A0A858RFR5_9BACT|nr:hypothetical protein [Luteolibacter luteus]QJE95555.1 hypothetical protein HHL09_07070 [Luteolibacter luteus]
MVANQHPAGLNPLQRFRQAGAILRGTSRATNPAWYQSALELDLQLHLRVDGSTVDSRIFDRRTKAWSAGPQLDESVTTDPSLIPAFAGAVLETARRANAQAIGIVLHVADEFATSELKPELDNPGALAELRTTIESDPKAVLDDASVSTTDNSWRLIPYPAAGSEAIATTISISHRWWSFLDGIRSFGEENNFPIVTRALSAPLMCLMAFADVKQDPVTRPMIAILPYPRFTVLAFFNEHGDLRLLRTLQHRGQRRPTNLRHATSTTAAALELADPEIHIIHIGEPTDPQLVADVQIVFPATSIHEVTWAGTRYQEAASPMVFPEPLIASSVAVPSETPLASSHTFVVLRNEGWASQDFLPMDRETSERFPTRGEMKLLRTARYARVAFAGAAALALCWVGAAVVAMVRQPEWAFNASDAQVGKQRLSMVTSERTRIDHWDNLLEDRSKAWVSMELLSIMFPEKSGFLAKSFNHTIRTESTPGQAKAGFIKEWKITGLAREQALERLATLNTRDGISAVFSEVAKVTGNGAFRPDMPSRSLVVNVRTLENSGYKPGPEDEMNALDEATYPFSFDLTITQRFESSDPMAVTASKAP